MWRPTYIICGCCGPMLIADPVLYAFIAVNGQFAKHDISNVRTRSRQVS